MTDALLEKLCKSKKYRRVCPATVERIYLECRSRYKKPKEAEKAAREKLHGITGAFLTPDEAGLCIDDMHRWAENGHADGDLEKMLAHHVSTRERLPLERLDRITDRVTELTGIPETVLDLACGLNPLYLGARGFHVMGMDISGESVDIINAFRDQCGAPVSAVCGDLLCPPDGAGQKFDMALLLKVLPLLEREKSGSVKELLSKIPCRHVVVSFPTRTLGGRDVGMEDHYAQWMAEHLPADRAVFAQFTADNELFYILKEN